MKQTPNLLTAPESTLEERPFSTDINISKRSQLPSCCSNLFLNTLTSQDAGEVPSWPSNVYTNVHRMGFEGDVFVSMSSTNFRHSVGDKARHVFVQQNRSLAFDVVGDVDGKMHACLGLYALHGPHSAV